MFLSSGVQDAREPCFPLPMRGVGLDECHLLFLASDHLVERRHQGPFVPATLPALGQMIEEGRDIHTLLVLNPERLQILATPKFNHRLSFVAESFLPYHNRGTCEKSEPPLHTKKPAALPLPAFLQGLLALKGKTLV